MGRSTRCVARAAALVVVLALGGCTQEVRSTRDGTEVVRQDGTLGVAVDYYGIDTSVIALEAFDQSTDGFPRIRVTIRSQSKLEVPWENPNIALRCEESSLPGDWYSGSTWEANGILPGGRINEGQIILGFPPKPDAERYPVPTCTDAAVEVTGTDRQHRDQQTVTRYAVPAEMIAEAIDSPRI